MTDDMKMRKKSNLPTKICLHCGLPFTWRKKWERDWENVKYCSDRCKTGKIMPTLRLILGDQLNSEHSWFKHLDPEITYLMCEIRQETDYVLHHAQKVLGIFAAMRNFAKALDKLGHSVIYLPISKTISNHQLSFWLDKTLSDIKADKFEYMEPDEFRLDQKLQVYCQTLSIETNVVSSEHFLTTRLEVAGLFGNRKKWLMETFYRQMRVRWNILMAEKNQPVGGQWNFDAENRKPYKGNPPEPADHRASQDLSGLWQEILGANIKTFGNPSDKDFRWPTSRDQAIKDLTHFLKYRLPYFGDFQDALTLKSWRLFHSFLSFALNTKMLHPLDVIHKAEQAYHEGLAPLAAVEGFIRQILGWREYIRGVYWAQMPKYRDENFFSNNRNLPTWFWDGKTKMQCLSVTIQQSLNEAYAHHIQRLMIVGNFSLLAGLNPQQLHEWYLGIYIDAFEWVELPNTLGMSQYADGGLLASKPYVSSASYINKMSDYCKSCHYNWKERVGSKACPMNALYWDFFDRHKTLLASNPRIGMSYQTLKKMAPEDLASLKSQAKIQLSNLNEL
jgi:deoxyribodipyrimidine photolyase-related protein